MTLRVSNTAVNNKSFTLRLQRVKEINKEYDRQQYWYDKKIFIYL